jgi:hypothetical protein
MSKELVVMPQDDFNRQLDDMNKIQDTCKKLLQTKHYANLGEAGIHAIMARAKALGIHPFEALNGGFHCIQGKVGMSTEMMAALVRKRGHSITKDQKSTNECVILHGKRADNGDTWTCIYSKADAEAAGLWGSATWKKYPGVMLYNRCMSQLFRQLFPDLSLGAGYVEDELKEITKTDEYRTIDVTPPKTEENVKPLYIAKTEESKPAETITTEQCIELAGILSECESSLKQKMLDFLKIQILDDMPASRFDEMKSRLIDNRTIYKAAQLKAAQDGE